ncbi:hypothetical protein GHO43_26715 [Pseudomonas sp. FSL R10-0071]|nr:hypothetical protein [Pseudomonas sp. FSL R10-0071]
MEEQKLLSFKLYDDGGERYRIVHKSGNIEELLVFGRAESRIALPVRLYSVEGRSVSFYYEDTAYPLMLTRIEVLLYPFAGEQGAALAKYELELGANGVVDSIVLPTPERARWRFTYKQDINTALMFITEAFSPVGGSEFITYEWVGISYLWVLRPQRCLVSLVTKLFLDLVRRR